MGRAGTARFSGLAIQPALSQCHCQPANQDRVARLSRFLVFDETHGAGCWCAVSIR
jgi:hypothetical protein